MQPHAGTVTAMKTTESEYQDGLAAGQRMLAGCNDCADIEWHQRIATDNLMHSRGRYYAGYVDGLAGAR